MSVYNEPGARYGPWISREQIAEGRAATRRCTYSLALLLAVPLLLCGARMREPEPVEIIRPSVCAVEAGAPVRTAVSVPGVKIAEGMEPQAERCQARRYPGADFGRLPGNAAQIVMYLLDAGMEPEAVCGVLANINRETGGTYDPLTVNDIGAVGLCQWLGVRAARLYQREDWGSISGQLAYLLEELAGTESGVDLSGSAYDCGYRFARDFERTGVAATYSDRGALAEAIYADVFSGGETIG